MNIKLMKSPKIGNSLLVVFTFSDKIKLEDTPFGNQFEIKGSKEFLKELKPSDFKKFNLDEGSEQ